MTTKTHLDARQLAALENAARGEKGGELVLIMRYTGMHPSVLVNPKYALCEVKDDKGRPAIRWNRPKKEGRNAFTMILKSRALQGIDVNEVVKSIRGRKTRKSRRYLYDLCKRIGEKAGIPGVSPMTLRHSACVDMLNRGVPQVQVQMILNVSANTMRTYAKLTDAGKGDVLEAIGW